MIHVGEAVVAVKEMISADYTDSFYYLKVFLHHYYTRLVIRNAVVYSTNLSYYFVRLFYFE